MSFRPNGLGVEKVNNHNHRKKTVKEATFNQNSKDGFG